MAIIGCRGCWGFHPNTFRWHSFILSFLLCQISDIAAPICVKRSRRLSGKLSRLLNAPQVIATQKYLKWRLFVDSSCRYGSGRSDLELLRRYKAERLKAEEAGKLYFSFPLQALKLTNALVLWERFLVFGAGDCESVLISCCGKMGRWFIYSTSLPGSEADLCTYCSSCAARQKLCPNKSWILCVVSFALWPQIFWNIFCNNTNSKISSSWSKRETMKHNMLSLKNCHILTSLHWHICVTLKGKK